MCPTLTEMADALTLEEMVSLLSGEDFWSLPAIPRLNIGKLRMTDGPNGARGAGSLVGGVTAAAFPVGISIGASWDTVLAREIGLALAEEVKSKGAHASLAPTVNIHRSVTNGRNFECFSEDPELTADLAVAMIQGLQSKGIAATIKHFAGNESEIERTTISSDIDERSLREIYLRPFEDAVKVAGTWGIMSSYNRLNGTYTAENHWLLTEVLRGGWGYDGIVMSDWFGSRTTAPTVNAGLDLEMPGPTRDRGAKLVAAVAAGEVSRDMIRTRVMNILRWLDRTGALSDTSEWEERADVRPEHSALIRRAGAAGTVLLTNDGTLPLTVGGTIAVIGPNAKVAQIMGGGSSQLNPHYRVSPWDALVERLGEGRLTHATGCTNHRWEPLLTGPLSVDYFANRDLMGDPVHHDVIHDALTFWIAPVAGGKVEPTQFSARMTGSFTPETSGLYRVGVYAAGYARVFVDGVLIADAWSGWTKGRTYFEEGCDEVVGEVALTAGRAHVVVIEFAAKEPENLIVYGLRVGIARPLGDQDIAAAVAAAAAADTAVIFAGRSGEWDTEGSDLLDIRLPGRQDALIAAVCAANPRTVVVLQTGGPVEMPWLSGAAAVLQAWYPGQEAGNAIADVIFGDSEPGGRLPQTFPVRMADNPTWSQDPEIYPGLDGHVRYEEGLFIGYRHYDKSGITPLFPFGHGLSYTTFDVTDLAAVVQGDGVRVTARVTNTGARAGSTVVQVYVGDPGAPVPRPTRALKGFAKVTLAMSEMTDVAITLSARDFAWFDTENRCWTSSPGRFALQVGLSSADIRAEVEVDLPGWSLPL